MLTSTQKKNILDLKKQKSIYAVFADNDLFRIIIDDLAKHFKDIQADFIVGLEARGFILGGALAYKLNKGFLVARKEGKMYRKGYAKDDVFSKEVIDYSGDKKVIEIEKINFKDNNRVIIIDDWIDTGSQVEALIELLEKTGAKVTGLGFILDQLKKEKRQKLKKYNFYSLIQDIKL